MSGLGDELKGSAKQVAGKVTGDDKLEAEGNLQEIGGKLKEKLGDAKDSAGDKVNEALENVKDTLDGDEES